MDLEEALGRRELWDKVTAAKKKDDDAGVKPRFIHDGKNYCTVCYSEGCFTFESVYLYYVISILRSYGYEIYCVCC